MQWTQDQIQALQSITKWYNIPLIQRVSTDFFYTLYGAAGTGKTTVALAILDIFKGSRVAVSAPTHKAKDTIAKTTNRQGLTLHSLLGLRPNLDLADFDPSNPSFEPMAEEQIYNYDIIIVDECSMISAALYKNITDKAIQAKKLVLFMGDAKQLPPVNEVISKVFLLPNKIELEEIVRQKEGNPNQQVLLEARDDAATNSNLIPQRFLNADFNINRNNPENKEQGYLVTGSQEEFYSKLIELYSDTEAKYNMNFIKTLAYTNNAVEKLNKFIKARINPSSEILSEGDFLLGYTTCMAPNGSTILVQNSSDYFIYHCQITTVKISMVTYKVFRVMISQTGKTIDILHPDSYPDFKRILGGLYEKAIKNRAWRPYYVYKDKFIIMQDFKHDTLKDRWGNQAVMAKKCIDLGYAMTVHKAQGSTYDNVAIIYNNFAYCRKEKERKQLTYVALSRTRLLNLVYI